MWFDVGVLDVFNRFWSQTVAVWFNVSLLFIKMFGHEKCQVESTFPT